jgi:hypothetical protein
MRSLFVAFLTAAACGPSPELVSAPTEAPIDVPIEVAAPAEPPADAPVLAEKPPPRACPPGAPPPALREANDLTVESPVRVPANVGSVRLRTHTHGPLGKGNKRLWGGPEVPSYVPISSGTKELFLLDQVEDHHVALYREPYDGSSCTLGGTENCAFEIRLFHCDATVAVLPLERFFSRPDRLEVQDVRYADGVIYFNEACQSYSREARGQCSSLVAIDAATKRVLWRTPPLQSNNMFVIAGDYLIAAYGFTAEPSHVAILRRSDGARVERRSLPSAHDALFLEAGDMLRVGLYSMQPDVWFHIHGLDGKRPRLVPANEPASAPSWRKHARIPALNPPLMPSAFPSRPPRPRR